MKSDNGFRQGISLAVRLGVEMLVATGIGAMMGYTADYYLGTDPWIMAVGVLFGGAAGVLNVYRAANAVIPPEDDDENGGSSGKSDDLLQ